MDPAAAATASSAFAWRRSLASAGAHAAEERERLVRRRVDELEAAVAWLRAEKEAAERAAAALRTEVESERGAAGTAASEAMLMIARLQREKSAAMIEAREFRRIVEGRAAHDQEVQDRLADVYKLAAAYRERLRTQGIDPDDESEHREEERARDGAGDPEDNDVVVKESPPSPAAEEFKYAVDVRCAAMTTKAVAKGHVAGVAADLCARVKALEAENVAVRREVAAERAQVALAREAARRCRDAAVVVGAEKQRFSVLAIFKWFFSTMLRGTRRSASAARGLRNPSLSATAKYFRLCLLPLLERFKGKMSGNGNGGRLVVLVCDGAPRCGDRLQHAVQFFQ